MRKFFKILLISLLCLSAAEIYSQAFTWQELGSGLQNGTNGNVYAITAYNGKIIYGGLFTRAGSTTVSNIASYDPASNSWSALGSGLNGEVKSLTVSGSDLIVGGFFTQAGIVNANNVAKWNGTNWSAMGSGLNGDVNALTVYSGSIVAGGNFSMPGGSNNVARWNGTSWVTMGNGLTGSGDRVNALTVMGANLVAGGRFEQSGSNDMSNVAKWNGTSWSQFNNNNFDDPVNAVIVFNGELYAGGNFTHIGGSDRKYIAKWNGSSWVSVGGGLNDGPVESFSVFRNSLIVGGNFRVTGTGLFVDRIASWSGSSWSRMLTGHNDHVYALHTFNSTDTVLYSGGEYTTAGGKWCYHAAMWGRFTTSSIGGQVRYADNNAPVLFGKVKIIRYDVVTREVIFVDSAVINNGTYLLPRVPKRDGLMRVISVPDDELDGGSQDTIFVPTFFPSTIQWIDAGMVDPGSNLVNIDIRVIRRGLPVMNNGATAIVQGNVFLNILPPMDLILGPFPFLKSSIVYLKKDTTFVKSAVTDENQHYTLGSVEPGTYTISVQRLGYEVESRQLVVGSVNLDTVNFYLDTLNVIGIENINSNVPDNFSLGQNYPNPFNPQTKIRFSIKQSSFSELKIFDILGREVKTLVNENLKAGEYEVSFNAAGLPSGVYFYMLKTQEFTETKKMVLIK